MNFDEVIQLHVLKLKATMQGQTGGRIIDSIIDQGGAPELRQMCAKVHPALHDRLEQITELLDMSKREFIERAVADALSRAEDAIARAGALDQRSL